ncbi:hypothetical protein KSS87_009662 [Heliosperma pusillum]|nr:hypothetical protein KSS87_009662 [Heliosperma pusillum]
MSFQNKKMFQYFQIAKSRCGMVLTILVMVMCITLILYSPLNSDTRFNFPKTPSQFEVPNTASINLSTDNTPMIQVPNDIITKKAPIIEVPTKVVEKDVSCPIYIFGDSLYDTGIAFFLGMGPLADSYPYGKTYFKRPAGRFSDGLLIPDYLAQHANQPFPEPYGNPVLVEYSRSVNFAGAAAGVLVDGRARKFAFQNYGPMGCLPLYLQEDAKCAEGLNDLAKLHNAGFAALARTWARQLPGFKYIVYDFYTSLMARVLNGAKYDFKETQTACCGSGRFHAKFTCMEKANFTLCKDIPSHLFFDPAHTTQRANQQFAKEFWGGPANLVVPFNMKKLCSID